MKNKNIVNLGAIRQGMKRFQFLLNCCEPGTIPDASILAAALDLVGSNYPLTANTLDFGDRTDRKKLDSFFVSPVCYV